jgi:uncharacterized protein
VVGGRALDASRLRPGGGAFLTIRRTPADVRAARLKLASVLVSPDRRAEVQRLLVMVTSWAKRQDDVQAVGLAGSWARNAERMSSDIDLVVLTSFPGQYVHSAAWLVDFGSPEVIRTKQWGVVTERRVLLASGLEIEFGFTQPTWASVAPVDAGTHRVVHDGLRPLFDPAELLARLVAAVHRG